MQTILYFVQKLRCERITLYGVRRLKTNRSRDTSCEISLSLYSKRGGAYPRYKKTVRHAARRSPHTRTHKILSGSNPQSTVNGSPPTAIPELVYSQLLSETHINELLYALKLQGTRISRHTQIQRSGNYSVSLQSLLKRLMLTC